METTLRVGVDSRGAVDGADKADRSLNKLGRTAKNTETQFQKLTRSLGGMRSLFASIGVGLVARQFTQLLDTATTIDNKLKVVTNTTAELTAAYDELKNVSERTRTSLEANATLFQRVGLATKGLGLSYKEQIELIESFNKALVISGTNAQEARAVTTQFAQALGSGFKGDELRSIIEQAPRVAQVVADSLGLKSVQELKKFAAEGKLAPKIVVDAFKEAQGQLSDEFAKTNITIGQGFQQISNSVIDLTRDFNNMTGASSAIGKGLAFIADNMDIVAGAAAGLAVVVGGQLVSAFLKMAAVVLANPLGILAVAFASAGAAAVYFGQQTFKVGEDTATGFQIAQAAFQTLYQVAQPIINLMLAGFELLVGGVQNFVSTSSKDLPTFTEVVQTSFNFVLSTVQFVADAIVIAFKNMPTALKALFTTAANAIITIFENILNAATGLVKRTAAIVALVNVDLAQKLQKSIEDNLTVKFDRIKYTQDEIDLANELAAAHDKAYSTDQIDKFTQAFKVNLTQIQAQARLGAVNTDGALNNVFSPKVDSGTEKDAKALKKLKTEREQFIKGLKDEYDSVRSETGQAREVVNEWYAEQKQKVKDLGLSWEEYGGKIDAVFKDKLKDAYEKDLENADDWASGVERAAMKLQESIGTAADGAEGAFNAVFGSMEDALTEFVSTGQLDFKKFADSILADISRIAVQQAIIKPLSESFTGGGGGSSFLSGLFGGGGGGGGGGIASFIGGLFKEGGLSTSPTSVGVMKGDLSRAPRFERGGMTSGGFPAILHPNEAVIPLSGGRKVPVDMGGQMGNNVNNISFNIQTPDADSFRRSEGQIMARLQSSMARASKRNN